jgi:hypothetical protein
LPALTGPGEPSPGAPEQSIATDRLVVDDFQSLISEFITAKDFITQAQRWLEGIRNK